MTPRGAPRVRVRLNSRGVWECRPYLGTDRMTHRPIRPYRSFPGAATEQEAQEAAEEWAAGFAASSDLGVGPTVASMVGEYVDSLPARDLAEQTVATYRSCLECYVAPIVGDVPARELLPRHVDAMYRIMRLRGGKDGRPVGASTVLKCHFLLRGAYRWMELSGAVDRNPMLSVPTPRQPASDARALEAAEFEAVKAAVEEGMSSDAADAANVRRRTFAMLCWLMLMGGFRNGESCALRRADVRPSVPDVRVTGTMVERPRLRRKPRPKTSSGMRNVAFDAASMARIEEHMRWQEAYLDRAGPSAPLCCLRDGRHLRPSAVDRWFGEMADEIGLPPGTTPHTLRHTHATWLIMGGADVRTVQERMGHARIQTTLGLYAHVMPGRDAKAAEEFSRIYEGM